MERLVRAACLRACSILMLFQASSAANAEPTGEGQRTSVLLAPQDVFSRGAAEWAVHLVLESLRREPGAVVVEPEELFPSESLARSRRLLQESIRLVEEGSLAYQDLELDKALAALAEAERRLPQVSPALEEEGARFWERLLSLLGAVYLLRGEQQAGQQIFRQLLTMQPDARLDEKLFPPRLAGIFQAVARDVERAEQGDVELISVPSASRVYLDLRFACVTPCHLPALTVGTHLLVARKSGFESVAKQIQVEAGSNRVQLHLPELSGGENLEALLGQAVSGAAGAGLPSGLGPLLERAALDRIVLGVLGRMETSVTVRLVMLEARSGKVLASAHALVSPRLEQGADRIRAAVADLLQGKKDVLEWSGRWEGTTGPLAGEERFDREEVPFWRKWWFWTSIGAGAAAVAVAVVLGVLLTRPGEPQGVFVLEF